MKRISPEAIECLRANAAKNTWRLLNMGHSVMLSYDMIDDTNQHLGGFRPDVLVRLVPSPQDGILMVYNYRRLYDIVRPLRDDQVQQILDSFMGMPGTEANFPMSIYTPLKITFDTGMAYVDVWCATWPWISSGVPRSNNAYRYATLCMRKAADVDWLLNDRGLTKSMSRYLMSKLARSPRLLKAFRKNRADLFRSIADLPVMPPIPTQDSRSRLGDICARCLIETCLPHVARSMMEDNPEYRSWLEYAAALAKAGSARAFWVYF